MSDTKTTGDLKDAILKTLIDRIENGEQIITKSGEVVTVDAPASTISVAVNYLKLYHEASDDEVAANELSPTLQKYAQGGKVMPFEPK